jgi:hypothetical protein
MIPRSPRSPRRDPRTLHAGDRGWTGRDASASRRRSSPRSLPSCASTRGERASPWDSLPTSTLTNGSRRQIVVTPESPAREFPEVDATTGMDRSACPRGFTAATEGLRFTPLRPCGVAHDCDSRADALLPTMSAAHEAQKEASNRAELQPNHSGWEPSPRSGHPLRSERRTGDDVHARGQPAGQSGRVRRLHRRRRVAQTRRDEQHVSAQGHAGPRRGSARGPLVRVEGRGKAPGPPRSC